MNKANTGEGIMVSDREFGELFQEVKVISKSVDKIEGTLYGNGKEGLYAIVKSNRETIDEILKVLKENNTNLTDLKDKVDEDVDKLDDHLKDRSRTLKGFLVDNWIALLLLFVILHFLVEIIVPANFTIWDVISKIIF